MYGSITLFVRFAKRWRNLIIMVHLYLCLSDRCKQKIHKSKKDRRFLFVQFYTVCLLYSYVFSVRTGQADRGINAPLFHRSNISNMRWKATVVVRLFQYMSFI